MALRKNHIEKSRKSVVKYFNPSALVADSGQQFPSPYGKYLARTSIYAQSKPETNWGVARFEILESGKEKPIFDFISNYHTTFHQWLLVGGREYFVCAEDIYGGQTIIDLDGRKIESFSPGKDGFISTEYNPSPTSEMLTTFGCVWAHPYRIKLFDFRDPMKLPWPEISGRGLFKDNAEFVEWIDRFQIKVKSEEGGFEIIDVSKAFERYLSKIKVA
jgi:hypothetical protein